MSTDNAARRFVAIDVGADTKGGGFAWVADMARHTDAFWCVGRSAQRHVLAAILDSAEDVVVCLEAPLRVPRPATDDKLVGRRAALDTGGHWYSNAGGATAAMAMALMGWIEDIRGDRPTLLVEAHVEGEAKLEREPKFNSHVWDAALILAASQACSERLVEVPGVDGPDPRVAATFPQFELLQLPAGWMALRRPAGGVAVGYYAIKLGRGRNDGDLRERVLKHVPRNGSGVTACAHG